MQTKIRSNFVGFMALVACVSAIGVCHLGGFLTHAEGASPVPTIGAIDSKAVPPTIDVIHTAQNTVTVLAADTEASEPLAGKENLGAFVIKRVGATDFELPVLYGISGSAINGADYAQLSGTVTIPKGRASVEVVIKPLGDLLVEADETVVITLETPPCPLIFPPPRTCYLLGTDIAAKVLLKNSTGTQPNQAPKVALKSPSAGEVRVTSGALAIVAEASDSDGKVVAVEFFVDNRSIGKQLEPLVGRWVMAWTSPTAGAHILFAQATDDKGATSKSVNVSIRILETSTPALSKLTVDNPKSGAVFQEPADITIDVTAVDPKGYIARVEFYSGENRIGVSEINFIRAPDPGTPIKHSFVWKQVKSGKYSIHARSTDTQKKTVRSETVSMVVEPALVVDQPVVSVDSPDQEASEDPGADRRSNIAVFVLTRAGGKDIDLPVYYSLSGTAENGKDYAKLAGKVLIPKGSKSAEIVLAPILDSLKEGVETVVITIEPPVCIKIFPPPPECYVVGRENQAKAILADSQGDSNPVLTKSVVTRVLPTTVVPGLKYVVQIKVAPAKGTASYALEEAPPKLWRVERVPENARFDAASGTLRIGPYFDDLARTISYTLVPTSASGLFKFNGVLAVETTRLEVGGDQSVVYDFQFHPADSNRQNQIMEILEVTAYGAAWKKGVKWPGSLNPIPASYVTKAAAIWKGGGSYGIDGSLGEAPKWWVNITEPVSPSILPLTLSGVNPLGAAPPAAKTASAVRGLHTASGAVRVQIDVVPNKAVSAYAVAEGIPAGWIVETVDGDGAVDSVNRQLKWLFLDATARSLSYVIRPDSSGASAASRLSGLLSFDGEDMAIQGQDNLSVAGLSAAVPRMASVQRNGGGTVALVIQGTPGASIVVEGSSDLRIWDLVFEGELTAGETVVMDESGEGSAMRFYRLKTP